MFLTRKWSPEPPGRLDQADSGCTNTASVPPLSSSRDWQPYPPMLDFAWIYLACTEARIDHLRQNTDEVPSVYLLQCYG